jgi:hypothetical protein
LVKRITETQANLIKPGKHKIISTSPYTNEDIRSNIRAVIVKDLKAATQE